MASARLAILLVALVLLLPYTKIQGGVAEGRSPPIPTPVRKVGVPLVAKTSENEEQIELVWKMVRKLGDLRMVTEKGVTATLNAALFVGSFKQRKSSILNSKRKLMSKRDYSRHPLDAKPSGFTAFNADYYVPKPHPPKNN